LVCLPAEAGGKVEEKGVEGRRRRIRSKINTHSLPLSHHKRSEQINRADVMTVISLAREYSGEGFGSEAINWRTDSSFNFVRAHVVDLHCYSYNERAAHLYKELSFVEEGRKKERVWWNGKWHDLILFAILESEWEVLRGIKL